MRILIYGINFHPEPTGIGKYTGEMTNWLAGRGHEVRVVTAPPFYPQWRVLPGSRAWKYSRERFRLQNGNGNGKTASGQHAQGPYAEIFRCPIWVPENPKGAKRLLHLASFGLSSVPQIVRQVRWLPDIVLLVEPTLFCALQTLLVARWSGAKAWLHIQDFEIDAAFELGDFSSSRVRDWALAVERRMLSVSIGFRQYPIAWSITFAQRESIPPDVYCFLIGWTQLKFIHLRAPVLFEGNSASQSPPSSRFILEAWVRSKDWIFWWMLHASCRTVPTCALFFVGKDPAGRYPLITLRTCPMFLCSQSSRPTD